MDARGGLFCPSAAENAAFWQAAAACKIKKMLNNFFKKLYNRIHRPKEAGPAGLAARGGEMAAQYTHQIIAETILAQLPAEARAAVSDLPAYYLGAQGPDVFYFFRLVTPRGGNLGKHLHNREVYRTFSAMCEELRGEARENPSALSYALGFVVHYAGDTVFHPFVYGTMRKLIAAHPKSRIRWHAYIESDIDSYIIRKERGVPVTEYVSPLREGEIDAPALAPFLSRVCAACGLKPFSERLFRRGVHRYFLFERTFTDRAQRRRKWLFAAENVLFCQHAFSSLCRRTAEDPRCINAAGEEWANPSDPAFRSCEGADALFARSVREGVRLIGEFLAALGGAPLPKEDFDKGFLSGVSSALPHIKPEKGESLER